MKLDNEHIKQQNIIYYDTIASDYDAIQNDLIQNNSLRKKVANKMTSILKNGLILDFGGGTGEDLKWLLANNYSVIFCEPSPEMRNVAVKKFSGSNVVYLDDDKSDFINWNNSLPFEEKVDGVIANFAVLNCIIDLDLLFKNLSLVTNNNAEIILLVLNYNLKRSIKHGFFKYLKHVITGKSMHIKTAFKNKQQLVYLHSLESIEKAARDKFILKSTEQLKADGFSLVHLTKK